MKRERETFARHLRPDHWIAADGSTLERYLAQFDDLVVALREQQLAFGRRVIEELLEALGTNVRFDGKDQALLERLADEDGTP